MATATAPINFDKFLPDGQTLFPFQQTGVAYALHQTQHGKGTFIADEQGLGKTRQAIVTAKVWAAIRGNYTPRILVVGKASLRGNLERELHICAPEWDVQILTGSRPYETVAPVHVISFNLLSKWQEALIEEAYDVLIVDESHKVKDPKTQQAKAIIKVAADIRARKGLVLLLTGTPILNRPVELVAQLRLIGRLEDVSPAPRGKANPTPRDWEFAFKNTFCFGSKTQWGTTYDGARHLDLLNLRLRSNCMVRRNRNDVLDLDETHRIEVPLSLNGGLDNYFDIEANFQPKHPNSAAIELLTQLRQAAGLAKIPAAVEWVADFIEENPTQKLVVWAWHVEVQRAITQALNEAGIEAVYWQEAKDIEAAKARFNEGSAKVIVCSLQSKSEGHTLTGNGTDVTDSLFVERPWHGAMVAQAEDRINRIGRQAAAVFAHTLVAQGTIDEDVEELIASKIATTKAAIDGTVTEINEDDDDIVKALVARLHARLLAKYGEDRLAPGDIV